MCLDNACLEINSKLILLEIQGLPYFLLEYHGLVQNSIF